MSKQNRSHHEFGRAANQSYSAKLIDWSKLVKASRTDKGFSLEFPENCPALEAKAILEDVSKRNSLDVVSTDCPFIFKLCYRRKCRSCGAWLRECSC